MMMIPPLLYDDRRIKMYLKWLSIFLNFFCEVLNVVIFNFLYLAKGTREVFLALSGHITLDFGVAG